MKKLFYFLLIPAILFSCTESPTKNAETEHLQLQIDSLKTLLAAKKSAKQSPISTFLTFQENNAEEAMNFYIELFDNSEILEVQRYEAGGPAPEGSILFARFSLNGKEVRCSDSYIKHEWDFTPGVSLFVDCSSNEELDKLFNSLADGGQIMMPLDNYGFSQRFGFVVDRFGVSWQLNLD